jgi:hypothetical protein
VDLYIRQADRHEHWAIHGLGQQKLLNHWQEIVEFWGHIWQVRWWRGREKSLINGIRERKPERNADL